MYCPNPECPNLLEHGVPAEYRDGIGECAECGHPLGAGIEGSEIRGVLELRNRYLRDHPAWQPRVGFRFGAWQDERRRS